LLGVELDQILDDRERFVRDRVSCAITDCKSVFDAVNGTGAPAKTPDRTASLDLVIIRHYAKRLGLPVRWCPTTRQIADAMTKDSSEATDLLRGLMRKGRYVLADEDTVMEARKEERARRVERGKARAAQATSSSKGGQRDYWLPPNSHHYIGKLARGFCDPEDILKIRIHQVPRVMAAAPNEIRGTPAHNVLGERCLILSRRADTQKLGPVDHMWRRTGETHPRSVYDDGGKWVGATVYVR
jgi:hypothetical protein